MIIRARKRKLLLYLLTTFFMLAVLIAMLLVDNVLLDDQKRIIPVRFILFAFLFVVSLAMFAHTIGILFHRKAILVLKDGVITDYNYLFRFPRKIDVSEIRKISFYRRYRGIDSYKFVLKNKTIYLTCMYCKNSTLQEFINAVEREMELLTKG